MQSVINLKVLKDNKTYSIVLHKDNKCKILNKNKNIKAKDLKAGDILLNNFIVTNNTQSCPLYKIKKVKELLITNNLQNFYEDMYSIFKDNPWDLSNTKALDLCKKYNIIRIQTLFLGVQVENYFGDIVYFSGEVLKEDFCQTIQKEMVDTSNYLKLQLF